MRTFIIRFVLFMLFWVIMIYEASSHLPFSVFMMTASLLFLFFLSNRNASIFVYHVICVIIFAHGFLIGESFYSFLLLLLIVITASIRISQEQLSVLFLVQLIYVICLTVPQINNIIFLTSIDILFGLLLMKINNLALEKQEHKELYEQLLVAYRELKRLHVSIEEVVKIEERTRIARDIHDSVGHRLTALIMKLEILRIQEPNEKYLELKQMANESLQETRQAVQMLQGNESKGLTAVVQLIRKLEAESNLLVHFTMKQGVLSTPLGNAHGIVLYRVFQEALTNVMRHSTSKHVHITIGKSAVDSLKFTISNPNIGTAKVKLGFGLSNMKARIKEIGGQVDIYQTKDEFIVSGVIPYK